MKKIEAFPLWYNGQMKNATLINVLISNVVLGSSADISYELFSEFVDEETNKLEAMLVRNSLTMYGEDYSNWGNDDDYVWNWVANKIGVTIVNN
jgi:hypothetical protein